MSRANRPVVVCIGFDWHHPSPLRHLELTLVRDHQLIHVESIGLRAPRPTWADLGRAWWKIGRMIGLSDVKGGPDPAGTRVVAPLVVPVYGLDLARWFNSRAVSGAIQRALPTDARPDLLITALPTAVDLIERIGARANVYYRVDDWPRWHGIDGPLIARLEQDLMDRVDLTLCTSQALLETAHSRHGGGVLLPQGVDTEHFGAALRPGPVHPGVAYLDGPVLGFFGTLDDRLDAGVLTHLSTHWPGTVALVGELRGDAPPMPRGGAVRHVEAVDYAELPDVARGVDAWLLPYVAGERTKAIDPLKLREYLATGSPIVATPLPEVARWRPHVEIGVTPDEVLRTALRLVAHPEIGRRERIASLEGHTWQDRRRAFLAAVAAIGGT